MRYCLWDSNLCLSQRQCRLSLGLLTLPIAPAMQTVCGILTLPSELVKRSVFLFETRLLIYYTSLTDNLTDVTHRLQGMFTYYHIPLLFTGNDELSAQGRPAAAATAARRCCRRRRPVQPYQTRRGQRPRSTRRRLAQLLDENSSQKIWGKSGEKTLDRIW